MKNALLLRIILASSSVALASGCTAGVVVDGNWSNAHANETTNATLTFQQLGSNLQPNGTNYNFNLNGQPYVSFDPYASNGATTTSYPGLQNSAQIIPDGNYRVEYWQNQLGGALYSPKFAHSYESTCTDQFNNSETGIQCETYYFQILAPGDPEYVDCANLTGQIQTLPTHNGIKVIELCDDHF